MEDKKTGSVRLRETVTLRVKPVWRSSFWLRRHDLLLPSRNARLLLAGWFLACCAAGQVAAQCVPTITTGTLALLQPVDDCPNWDTSWWSDMTQIDQAVSGLYVSSTTLISVKASTGTCVLPNLALVLGSGAVTCAQPSDVTGNAATVTTNANLTGNVTSVGNATTIAAIPAVSGALLTSLTGANVSGSVTTAINVAGGGEVSAASGTFTNGITASSGTFTATGSTQYSVLASSGISALLFNGDGSQLTGVLSVGLGAAVNSTTTFTAPIKFSSNVVVGGAGTVAAGDVFRVQAGSMTVDGLLHVGLTEVLNTCASVNTCTATCPAGTYLLSGGCNYGSGTPSIAESHPAGNLYSSGQWTCVYSATSSSIYAIARCSRFAP